MSERSRVLYLITCATPVASILDTPITLAHDAGWDVHVLTTPDGRGFLNSNAIEEHTGHPVRWRWRTPHEPRTTPRADAVLVAGASFNTLNKWATGITDNLALATLTELMGLRVPIVVLPFFNTAMSAHPALAPHIAVLRAAGVTVLLGPDGYQPHPPHTGRRDLATYPWRMALDHLHSPGTT